jgi:predicted component of type VI protein secretion system
MKQASLLLALAASVLLAGCVQIQAPDKPIEINLNVNIKQEVVLTLKKDAQDLVNNNPELFPQ